MSLNYKKKTLEQSLEVSVRKNLVYEVLQRSAVVKGKRKWKDFKLWSRINKWTKWLLKRYVRNLILIFIDSCACLNSALTKIQWSIQMQWADRVWVEKLNGLTVSKMKAQRKAKKKLRKFSYTVFVINRFQIMMHGIFPYYN